MDQWKQWFALLLPLSLCFDTEETSVKTIGREQDVTQVCTNATLHIITLIVCKISTKRNRGEECRLLYQHGQDFEHECDFGFTLTAKNQTVFLSLTNLTPDDSGNYTCECSHIHGTDVLHLSITVEGDEEASTSLMTMLNFTTVISIATAFIIVIGVVLGLILRKSHFRDHTRSGPCGLPECEARCPLDKDDPEDFYTSLQQPASDHYQIMSSVHHEHDTMTNLARNNTVATHLEQDIDGRDTGQNYEIYETIS